MCHVRSLAVLLVAGLVCAPAPVSSAGEEKPGARLAELLGSQEPLGNTIPVEQEILRLREAKEADALLPFIDEERFGFLVFWAVTDIARPDTEEAARKAFSALPLPERVDRARWLASYRSEGVRQALRALREDPSLPAESRRAVDVALLRADDATAVAGLKAALGGKDAEPLAAALLLAGDARRADFLADAAKHAGDERALSAPVESEGEIRTRTDNPGGGWTETSTHPALRTLGDVAVEAASRMVKPMTPEMMAWWYEPEKGLRFVPGAEGRALLAAWVAADAKAAAAGGPRAEAAYRRALARLREANPEFLEVRLTAVTFDGAFRFTGLVNGETAELTAD